MRGQVSRLGIALVGVVAGCALLGRTAGAQPAGAPGQQPAPAEGPPAEPPPTGEPPAEPPAPPGQPPAAGGQQPAPPGGPSGTRAGPLAPQPYDPKGDLKRAGDAIRFGKWEQAVPLLTSLLYPRARLSSAEDLAEAHVLLGVALFELNKIDAANEEFRQAIFLNPLLELTPLVFSDAVVAHYNERKTFYEEEKRRADEASRLAAERERLQEILDSMVIVEKHPFYINLIPLGAGQFQNGHKAKGTAFLVSQLILGGASLGLWTWQVTKFGFGGEVPTDEVRTVQRVQQLQIATGSAALALMAWGVIDALWYYKPSRRLAPDPAFLPKHLRDKLAPPARGRPDRPGRPGAAGAGAAQLDRSRVDPGLGGLAAGPGAGLAPMVVDGGAGVVFWLEF